MPGQTEQLIAFINLASELTAIERFKGQTYWAEYPSPGRWESVADHSWRLALLLQSISDQLSRPIDLSKALRMCLIHDLPEIIT